MKQLPNFSSKYYLTRSCILVSKYFVKDCRKKQNSLFNLVQTSWNLHFLQILVSLKPFMLLKLMLRANEMWQVAKYMFFRVFKYIFDVNSWSNCSRLVYLERFCFCFQKKNVLGVSIEFLKIIRSQRIRQKIFPFNGRSP